jgi:hypothetical protein
MTLDNVPSKYARKFLPGALGKGDELIEKDFCLGLRKGR